MTLRIFFLLFSILMIASCNKSKEGCLDLLASNFDPLADSDCENCCLFPSVEFQIKHVFNNKEIDNFRDTFKNNLSSSFKIIDQLFYLSDVSIFSKKVEMPFITRSKFFFNDNSSETLFNNIGLVKNVTKNIAINTIRTTLIPDSLYMTVGMSTKFNKVNFKKLDPLSPLSENNGMYSKVNNEYYTYSIKVIGGPNLKDTISINTTEDITFSKSFVGLTPKKGLTLSIPLIANYSELTKDINFNQSKAIIEAKLKANLKNFIQ
jgi:hypothetical protein